MQDDVLGRVDGADLQPRAVAESGSDPMSSTEHPLVANPIPRILCIIEI
jgi:hypothetical protein